MSSTATLKAVGLNKSPNQLDLSEGSLTVASNVVISRDNVIESRRGFKLYGNSMGTSSDRAKQLLSYKNRILRHYSDVLQFDSDDNGTFLSFAGSVMETEPGLRIKGVEVNGNFYFTTSEGIKKISSVDATGFSTAAGFVTQAGGIKAIDLTAVLNYNYGDQTSFLTQDGAVAYRVVWGTTDANGNLILGAPSQRTEVFNSMLTLLLQDYMILLQNLDNLDQTGSLIDDGNYVSTLGVTLTSSAVDLRTSIVAMAAKIDNDILYADNDGSPTGAPLELNAGSITAGTATLTFASGTATDYWQVGSKIFLAGFTTGTGDINGAQVVTSVTAGDVSFNTAATGSVTIGAGATIVSNEYRSFITPDVPSTPATHDELLQIQIYMEEIIDRLNQEPVAVISAPLAAAYVQILDVTKASTVTLTITIPDGVTTDYFYQVYRSAVALAEGAAVLSTDVFPSDELQLVFEGFPTQAEIDAGFIIFVDVTPDAFRGANLYTNAATGEGILQANDVPPFAKDINVFKSYVFYANTRTRHRHALSLLGVQAMIDSFNAGDDPSITITNGIISNTYHFVVGQAEISTVVTNAASTLNASGTADYFLINSGDNVRKYYVWYNIGTATDPLVADRTGIMVVADAGWTATQVAEKTRDILNGVLNDFVASTITNTITITRVDVGYTDNITDGTTGFVFATTQQGAGEKVSQEQSRFTTVADVAGSLAGTYFTINTAENRVQNYVWYRVSGVGTDPAVANKIGIRVDLVTGDSANTVALKTATELNTNHSLNYTTTNLTNTFTVTNVNYGRANDATVGTSGFTLTILEQGALDVLLSTVVSPAQAVELTSTSFIRVINRNGGETVYGYYLSGAQEVPGRMNIESRTLNDIPFYILANNTAVGLSFNPTLSPTIFISSISTGSPTTMLITTSTPHGLVNLDTIVISGSNSTPSIDGAWQITYVSPTTFRIDTTITVAGTEGAIINANAASISANEDFPNRLYYSKFQQPEAVPILNYLDVGAKNKQILRIFPIRDSLFIFKEDGLYRLSGEVAPFNLALFDVSCILVAPDSVAAANNFIYCSTRQGIQVVSESGATTISRPIDVDILKLSSDNYTNFRTATWGIGYESDNSYLFFTVTDVNDTMATQCFRYSNLTNSFTTYDKTDTCGVMHPVKDRLYLGAGDTNFLEEERKTFSRFDYADRELTFNLNPGNYLNNTIFISNVDDVKINDALVQTQSISVYEFNMLLKKLDIDGGVSDSNYFATLEAFGGDSLRLDLLALATKLDADPGVDQTTFLSTINTQTGAITVISAENPTVITSVGHGLLTGRVVVLSGTNSVPNIDGIHTVTVIDADTFSVDESVITPGTAGTFVTDDGDFQDLRTSYNAVINMLNNDINIHFSNYQLILTDSIQETTIIGINRITRMLTLDRQLDYIVGELVIFNSIECVVHYAPNTMGDPLGLKKIYEATIMFLSNAFTRATVGFATDLLPSISEFEFTRDGNGTFGNKEFGQGFFGGASNSAPFRTYIPRDKQYCRYIVMKFKHNTAREIWSIYGITLTGNTGLSTRAYR